MKFIEKFKSNGRKRSFLIYGIFNFIITNIALQISLLILPIYYSTIISQFINLTIGCFLYGRNVFRVKKITFKIFKKYISLAIFIWILNSSSISFLFSLGINKNLAAIYVIPFLVATSYLIQSKFVFNER